MWLYRWGLWAVGFTWAEEYSTIYISPTGVSNGTSDTRSNPYRLRDELSLISAQAWYVQLAAETYPIRTSITIPLDSAIIKVRYLPARGWEKSDAAITTIICTGANAELMRPFLTVIQTIGRRGFRMQAPEIEVADVPVPAIFIHEVYLRQGEACGIAKGKIHGGKGRDGINAAFSESGAAGTPREAGGLDCQRYDFTYLYTRGVYFSATLEGSNGFRSDAAFHPTDMRWDWVQLPPRAEFTAQPSSTNLVYGSTIFFTTIHSGATNYRSALSTGTDLSSAVSPPTD